MSIAVDVLSNHIDRCAANEDFTGGVAAGERTTEDGDRSTSPIGGDDLWSTIAVQIASGDCLRSSTGEQVIATIQTIEIVACKNLQAIVGFVDCQNFFVAIAIEVDGELVNESIASAKKEHDIVVYIATRASFLHNSGYI